MNEHALFGYIESWVNSRPKLAILRRDRVSAFGWTYERFTYLDHSRRVLSYGYMYSQIELFPMKSEKDLPLLGTSDEINSGGETYDLESLLYQGLTVYEDEKTWAKEKPRFPKPAEFLLSLKDKLLEVLSEVKVFSLGKFNVVNFQQSEGQVLVFFTRDNCMQLPVVFNMNRPSPVLRRDYKEDTELFELFVESIGELLGGVVWYG